MFCFTAAEFESSVC